MPKSNLVDVEIREFSAVANPAHKGARAVLMKRKDPEDPASSPPGTSPVSKRLSTVLTSAVDGHQHGIELSSNGGCWVTYSKGTEDDYDHTHALAKGPDGSFSLGLTNGHTHTVDQAALVQALAALLEKGSDMPEPTAEELQASLDAANARADRAEKIAALTPDHRTYWDGLAESDQDPFLAKSAEERTAEIAASTDADPVVYTSPDGTEFRKSADPALVAAVRKADNAAAQVAALQAQAEQTALEKRAETDLGHTSGSLEARVAILRSVDAIEDEDTRTAALESLKSNDQELAKAFKRAGHAGQPAPDTKEGGLEKRATELSKSGDLTYQQALAKLMREDPDAAAAYDESIAATPPVETGAGAN